MLLPFWDYRFLPARNRLDTDARGAGAAHPRHLVTSHARTVIVDRDTGLALRPAKKKVFFFFEKHYMDMGVRGDKVRWDDDIVKTVLPNDRNTYFLCELLLGIYRDLHRVYSCDPSISRTSCVLQRDTLFIVMPIRREVQFNSLLFI